MAVERKLASEVKNEDFFEREIFQFDLLPNSEAFPECSFGTIYILLKYYSTRPHYHNLVFPRYVFL
jgi:hypothetical protein